MKILINTEGDLETFSDISIMLAKVKESYTINLNSRHIPLLAYQWLQDFNKAYPDTDIWNTLEYLETLEYYVRHQIKGVFNIDISLK